MAKQHFSCKVCRGAGLHHRHGGDALFGRAIVMTASHTWPPQQQAASKQQQQQQSRDPESGSASRRYHSNGDRSAHQLTTEYSTVPHSLVIRSRAAQETSPAVTAGSTRFSGVSDCPPASSLQ